LLLDQVLFAVLGMSIGSSDSDWASGLLCLQVKALQQRGL
jgi:hypothetical protein